MAWVKIDDQFPEHPKVAQAGPLAMAMQVAGLCYCNRKLTDGFIPRSIARRLLDWQIDGPDGKVYTVSVTSGMTGDDVTSEWVIGLLVDAGIWHEVDGGYQIHDYHDYQPSKSDVEADREAARERMANLRAKRKQNKESRSGGSSDDVRPNISRSSVAPVPDPDPLKSHDDTRAPAREDDDPEWRELTLAVLGATHDGYTASEIDQDIGDLGLDAVKEAMRRSVENATGNRLAYYRKIVRGWRGKVKSVEDIRKLDEAARPPARDPPRRLSTLELAAQAKGGTSSL